MGRDVRLVGRADELAAGRAFLAEVAGGAGAALVVEGEAGIGKSSLVRALLAEARPPGDAELPVRRGTCSELEADLPFAVWVRALGLRAHADDPLAAELGRAITDPDAPAAAQLRAIDGIAELVERDAIAGPLVLWLDDLQWADERSLAALARIADLAMDLPIGIVASRRPHPQPEGVTTWERPLDREGALTRVRLGPLGQEELVGLAEGLLDGPVGDDLAARLRATGGNPLFAREVVLAAGSGDAGDGQVREAILRHLDFVPEGAWPLLRTAAALGTRFEAGDVALVDAVDTEEVLARLAPAVSSGVLVDGDGLAFAHDLVREAVEDSETPSQQALRHARITEALDRAGRPPRAWAGHLQRADAASLADPADLYRRAGRAMLHQHAPTARRLLDRALELRPEDDEVRVQLAGVTFALSPYRDNRLDTERFLRVLGPLATPEALARTTPDVRARLLTWFPVLPDDVRREVVRAAREHGLPPAVVPALDFPWERIHEFDRELDDATAAGLAATADRLLAVNDPAAVWLGFYWEQVRVAQHSPQGRQVIIRAARRAQEVIDRQPDVLDPLTATMVREALAMAGEQGGLIDPDVDPARVFEEMARDLRRVGLEEEARVQDLHRLYTLWLDAVANAAELAEAAPVAMAWLDEGQHTMTASRYWLLGWNLWRGERETADRVLATLDDGSPLTMQIHALDRWSAGDPQGARAHLEALATYLTERVHWTGRAQQYALARRVGAMDVWEGHAVGPRVPEEDPLAGPMHAGDPDAILTALEESGWPPIGYLGLDVREDVADLLAEQGRTDEAIEVLRQSLADWTAIGASACVARVTARLRDLGVSAHASSVRRAATHGWESITEAEWRVLDLLEQDLIYREIAERLFLSRRTVESHVASVFRKLQVKGRRNLARLLREGEGAAHFARMREGAAPE